MTPPELRRAARNGKFSRSTSGLCQEHVHANLIAVPQIHAGAFRRFCERNPKACPLVEEVRAGEREPRCAPGADLSTDLPRYRIFREGALTEEPTDVSSLWRDDLVSFLLGCSFNFERALADAGVPIRHQEENRVVPMFVTNHECRPAGVFSGPLVVSMRPVQTSRVADVRALTARFSGSHGEPVAVGEPESLGIVDLSRPDYGDPVTIRSDEVPVFWACGVTPQALVGRARMDLCVTHAPGHMFVTDLRTEIEEARALGS